MNYSIIDQSRKKLDRYEKMYNDLQKQISLLLITCTGTSFDERKKEESWKELLSYVNNVVEQIKSDFAEINNVQFSQEESKFFLEEKELIVKEYLSLAERFEKQRQGIAQQKRKEVVRVNFFPPKIPENGLCYVCNTIINSNNYYKLGEEEKSILEIDDLKEEIRFCSSTCFIDCCQKIQNQAKEVEKLEENLESKVSSDEKIVKRIQLIVTNITKNLNEVIKKKKEAPENEPKVGFFYWLGQKVGLSKKTFSLKELQEEEQNLRKKMKVFQDKLKKALLVLSVDKQKVQEMKILKKRKPEE